MEIVKKPGYETTEQLWSPNPNYLKKFVDKKIIPFLLVNPGDYCFDLGEANPRMEYLKKQMKLEVVQIDSEDFNFDTLPSKTADVVFAFEVVEHLQNPLWFMNQLKKLVDSGCIYIIIPENPKWLWHEMHFFEMDRKHFEKWLIKPLDLRINRHKKIIFIPSWKAYLIGFRPLFRLLTGKTTIYEMIRSLLYVQWRIYEIRKD
jgi:hypothetical protein